MHLIIESESSSGSYGTGKTEFSVNYALQLAARDTKQPWLIWMS
jgi:hypothetical protein